MNSDYIYDVFEVCKRDNLPDLTVALAHYKDQHPIPEGMTEKGIREFVGQHYAELVAAFQTGGRDTFAAAVAACEHE